MDVRGLGEREHDEHDDAAPEVSADAHRAGRIPVMRLFVRRAHGVRRPLEMLRLDCWGDTLLGTKLRGELATGYAILVAVCVFEVCAWTLLFNYILQGARFEVSWWTCVATGLGLLWGVGIFTIDKNLITSDLARPGLGKIAGAGARIVLVLGSAYLTAQPIEQLVFRSMIEQRLKEETLRREAVAYVGRVHELRAQQAAAATATSESAVSRWRGNEVQMQRIAVEGREAERSKAAVAVEVAEAAKQRAERWLASATRRWDEAQREDPRSAAAQAAERGLQGARNAASRASATLDAARAGLEAARQDLKDSGTTLAMNSDAYVKSLNDNEAAKGKTVEALRDAEARYVQFFDRLRKATYRLPLLGETGELFQWEPAGAMKRAAVLAQLRDGEPARWPEGDRATLTEAAQLFGLPTDFDAPPRDGAFALWLLVLLVAAAIPSLSVFYKLTTSRELKLYYSVEDQASAGNPDAVVLQRAHQLRASRAPNAEPPAGTRADTRLRQG